MKIVNSYFFTLTLMLLQASQISGQQIYVIESQSLEENHNMDEKWENAFLQKGFDVSIQPQNTLDFISNLNDVDILIISSGLIELPTNSIQTIELFIQQGGNVYLQSEYHIQAAGNQAFSLLVNNLGGSFAWEGELSGNLTPVHISSFFQDPLEIIPYFWFGTYGSGGDNIIPFLRKDDKDLGFYFCSPNPTDGTLITISDQDWIRGDMKPELIDKIIYFLLGQNYFQMPLITTLASEENPCEGKALTYSIEIDSLYASIIGYQWYVDDSEILGAQDSVFLFNSYASHNVYCKINFQKNCSQFEMNSPTYHQTNFVDTTFPNLAIHFDSTQIYCKGEPITFMANATFQKTPSTFEYQWLVNQLLISEETSSIFTINNLTDEDIVSCHLIYDNICDSGIIVYSNNLIMDLIEMQPDPSINIEAFTPITCENDPITFAAYPTDLGMVTNYTWTIDGVIAYQGTSIFIHDNPLNGQVIKCETISNSLCLNNQVIISNTLILELNSIVIPNFNIQANTTTICKGESIQFEVVNTNTIANDSIQYQWQVDEENVGMNSPLFDFAPDVNLQSIKCVIKLNGSCFSTKEIITDEIRPEVIDIIFPTIDITTNQSNICTGELVHIEAIGTDIPANSLYNWFIDNQLICITTVPFFNSDTITHLQSCFCKIDISEQGCINQQTIASNIINFTVSDMMIDIIELHPEMCGKDGQFEMEIIGGMEPYNYDWNDGIYLTQRQDLYAGNYPVTVTDALGCQIIDTITIDKNGDSIFSNIQLEDYDFDLNYGYLKASTNAINPTYSWDQSPGLSCFNCSSPFIHGEPGRLYKVQITDLRGCTTSSQFELPILVKNSSDNIYIPNAFTPNGDGVNDFFTAYGYNGNYKIKNIRIYNRTQNLVFEKNNLTLGDEAEGWNGRDFKTSRLHNGVYIYIITIQKEEKLEIFKGDITIY